MPKFVPRQRKHKVIARLKSAENQHDAPDLGDSNATELGPTDKASREERKRKLRAEIEAQGPKVSGKKAKRLEKYLETKLRKDENRELIQKLSATKVDTSYLQSSSKLGQAKEARKVGPITAQNGTDDESNDDIEEVSESVTTKMIPQQTLSVGGGLKRPLEVDEEGNAVIKKRKRRKKSKPNGLITEEEREIDHDIPWEGFSSESERDANIETSDEEGEEDDSEDVSESDENSSDEQVNRPAEFRSAFTAWAKQQMNNALGYKPSTIATQIVQASNGTNFHPRAPDQDPLPIELQPTKEGLRKAYSVTVERTPEIQAGRLKLPVVAEEQKIMEAIHNNPTVVICGATGSGKTTQVPQFLFEAGYGSPNSPTPGMIGITQPRRVAAVSMSKRVGEELGENGKRVAYQIRFEGTMKADTAIKFMTDGVLLRELAQDIALRKYSAIIIDEAHERTINTDILIGMMSKVVKLRGEMALEDTNISPLKLIIMSATLRVTDFTANELLFPDPPPVLEAEGRQFAVTNHFARITHHDYVEQAFQKIQKGHRKLPPGGFLVFLTGQNEIKQLSEKLKNAFGIGTASHIPQVHISGSEIPMETEDIELGGTEFADDYSETDSEDLETNDDDGADFEIEEAESGPNKMHILPLYSQIPTKEQVRVFEEPPDGSRLVILATNVAETSLTIPGIRYVFDTGRSKERVYDQQTGVQRYDIGWISKASANQRAGRAGRTGPGHCYRLYSSAVYERDLPEFTIPEILRMPIEGVVLQLKAMNLQNVVNFPFPSPPDAFSLSSAEKLLKYLEALSPVGKITEMGSKMSMFPMLPRYARILLIGHLHDCMPYTIALLAGLSVGDVFIPDYQAIPAAKIAEEGSHLTTEDHREEEVRGSIRRKYNQVHKTFCSLDDKSDAMKLLQAVGEFALTPTEEWCQDHFVRYKAMKEILQLRQQITKMVHTHLPHSINLKWEPKLPRPSLVQIQALKQIIATGFIDHVAIRADLAPDPPATERKSKRAIDVPYLTLLPSYIRHDEEDKAVYIHPSSPLAHLSVQECPQYIIYSDLNRSTQSTIGQTPKTRMLSLTSINGKQLANLAKGTPLIGFGKPIKKIDIKEGGMVKEYFAIPFLRPEGSRHVGWPLPARKVVERKIPGGGWVIEKTSAA